MSEGDKALFAGAAVMAIFLATSIAVWPLVTQTYVGMLKSGATPATGPDTTASHGTLSQRAADGTVGQR